MGADEKTAGNVKLTDETIIVGEHPSFAILPSRLDAEEGNPVDGKKERCMPALRPDRNGNGRSRDGHLVLKR